jgi:hypothetical protein
MRDQEERCEDRKARKRKAGNETEEYIDSAERSYGKKGMSYKWNKLIEQK